MKNRLVSNIIETVTIQFIKVDYGFVHFSGQIKGAYMIQVTRFIFPLSDKQGIKKYCITSTGAGI